MTLTSGERQLIAVKSELTYGLDVFGSGPPAAYQAFRSATITPITEDIESPRATWTASGEKSCLLLSHNDVSWEMPFTGKLAAAGTSPAWDAFMLASGFKKTVVAATSVTYAPRTKNDMTDTPSLTMWKYMRQLELDTAYLYKARGYRGNFTIKASLGEEAVISGAGMALYNPMPNATIASPTPPTSYEGNKCMVPTSMVFTCGGVTYEIQSIEFSTNWTVDPVRLGEVGFGTLSKVLLDRPMSGSRMGGSFRLVSGGAAYVALVTAQLAGSQVAMSLTLTNGVDTITITAPSLQFGRPTTAVEGIIKYDCPFFLNRGASAGDDEIAIICT